MADENHPVMEGIPELTLNIPANELMVLYETIIDFKNLKDNVYPVLVKQIWVHATAEKI